VVKILHWWFRLNGFYFKGSLYKTANCKQKYKKLKYKLQEKKAGGMREISGCGLRVTGVWCLVAGKITVTGFRLPVTGCLALGGELLYLLAACSL
jgi:hypothetical protein